MLHKITNPNYRSRIFYDELEGRFGYLLLDRNGGSTFGFGGVKECIKAARRLGAMEEKCKESYLQILMYLVKFSIMILSKNQERF